MHEDALRRTIVYNFLHVGRSRPSHSAALSICNAPSNLMFVVDMAAKLLESMSVAIPKSARQALGAWVIRMLAFVFVRQVRLEMNDNSLL